MRLLLIFLFVPFYSFAQEKVEDKEYTRNIYSIAGFMGPQAGFELQTRRNQTILLRAGFAPVYYTESIDHPNGLLHQITMSVNHRKSPMNEP